VILTSAACVGAKTASNPTAAAQPKQEKVRNLFTLMLLNSVI